MGVEVSVIHVRDGARRCRPRTLAQLGVAELVAVREPSNTHYQHRRVSWYWLSSTGTHVTCRSRLAERQLRALDFAADVVGVCAEPFVAHANSRTTRGRTPDFLVQATGLPLRVIDVMSDAQREQKVARTHVALMQAVCDDAGWDYELRGEPDAMVAANLSWLAGFRRPMDAAPFIEAILERAAEPVALRDLADETGPAVLTRPVVFHLLWRQLLSCDLSVALSDTTLVRSGDVPAR
jgi:hypothetical protein